MSPWRFFAVLSVFAPLREAGSKNGSQSRKAAKLADRRRRLALSSQNPLGDRFVEREAVGKGGFVDVEIRMMVAGGQR